MVAAGQTKQFKATGNYSDGTSPVITELVDWASDDTAVATIVSGGLATSYAPGTATITATLDAISGNTILTVTEPVLEAVSVTPDDPEITYVAGAAPTLQFTATAIFSDGSTADIRTAATTTWTSSDHNVAEDPPAGLVTTKDPGVVADATTITATDTATGISGDSELTVLPDKVPPVVALTSPMDGFVTANKNLAITGSIDDINAPTVEAIVNGDTGNPVALTLDGEGNFSKSVLLNTGNNTIYVRAVDGANNSATSPTVTVEVNPNKPGITITSPSSGTLTNNTSITVTGTVDITMTDSATLIINGESQTLSLQAGGSFTETVNIDEGTNVIVVNAYTTIPVDHTGDDDYLGTSGVILVTRDTSAPVVTIDSPVDASIVGAALVETSGMVDDPGVTTVRLILNGSTARTIAVVEGEFSQSITLAPGANTVAVSATDQAGNTSSSQVNVIFDNTKPGVTIIQPGNKLVTNVAGQRVTGTVSDPSITTATLVVSGTSQTISVAPDGSFSKMVTLSEGENTIEVTATDAAENTGRSGEVKVTVDVTLPELTVGLTNPTDTITITVTSNEPLEPAPTVNIDPAIAPAGTVSKIGINRWSRTDGSAASPIATGDYTVTIIGADQAGNSATKRVTFNKERIDVDGINPTTVETEDSTLEVETHGAVANADISVTTTAENPSGNVGNPEDAAAGAGVFVEIVAAPELRDNLKQISIRVDYDPDDLPADTDESTLRLYLWDVASGTWTLVPDSGVNIVDHFIYGTVEHLSRYGGFGSVVPPPAPAPGAPTARPAAFVSSDLSITPAEVDIGETVTISVLVTNTGDLEGTYQATLKIDDVVVDTKEVTLAGGASETVTFTVSKDVAGTYTVTVDSLSGKFNVKAPFNWWLVIGPVIGLIIIIGVIVWLVIRRRRA